MTFGGNSHAGAFIGRDSALSMTNGILYNSRQQAQGRSAADRKAADIETASVSTYASSDSAYTIKPETHSSSSSKRKNGTNFSIEELNRKAMKSQLRLM